ncbi:MAG: PqqD family peptide modification chaperone [Clostridia bacterium]
MTVMKNKEMEYIQVDEKSLVIYDPDSGDTHFIDEVGQSILNLMEEEVTVDALVETLSQMYISEGDEIRHDVEAFLRELIEKKGCRRPMRIRTAYIEITNQCNFDCATCYNRSGQNLETLELSPTQVRGMVARLSEEFGCQRILLAGGEPCLHSQFQEILELRETFPAIELGVVTNGSIQDECLIERYLQDEKGVHSGEFGRLL